MKKNRQTLAVGLLSFLTGCNSTIAQPDLKNATGLEFDVLYFRVEMPSSDMGLMESLINAPGAELSLSASASFLKGRDDIRVLVVGFADKDECQSSDCDKLSRARAFLVFDWLTKAGVSPKKLSGYFGCADKSPVDFSYTELQRQGNRRVEIRALDESAPVEGGDGCV